MMAQRRWIRAADDDAAWRFVAGFVEQRGYAPTLHDIAQAIGRSKSAVFLCLRRLEARGVIRRVARLAQAIELVVAPVVPRAPDGAPLWVVPIGVGAAGADAVFHGGDDV